MCSPARKPISRPRTTSTSLRSSSKRQERPASLRARCEITDRSLGDYAEPDRVEPPSSWRVPPQPWTVLHQVHGGRVVTVSSPGQHAGVDADAAVTAEPGRALVVRTADCAPIVLAGDGVVGVAHAGWRGLLAGVVEHTVAAMRALGGNDITATIGPCIHPECYEFGAADLAVMTDRFGDGVRAATKTGTAALDLAAAVRVALDRADVADVASSFTCTACDLRWYSHRARHENERMAAIAWLEP